MRPERSSPITSATKRSLTESGVSTWPSENNTEDNFEEVAVVLNFGGRISAYFDQADAEDELDASLPAAPRPWGPYRLRPTDYASLLGRSSMPLPYYPNTAPRPYR